MAHDDVPEATVNPESRREETQPAKPGDAKAPPQAAQASAQQDAPRPPQIGTSAFGPGPSHSATAPQADTKPTAEPPSAPDVETEPTTTPPSPAATAPQADTKPTAEPPSAPDVETEPATAPSNPAATAPQAETKPKATPPSAPDVETEPATAPSNPAAAATHVETAPPSDATTAPDAATAPDSATPSSAGAGSASEHPAADVEGPAVPYPGGASAPRPDDAVLGKHRLSSSAPSPLANTDAAVASTTDADEPATAFRSQQPTLAMGGNVNVSADSEPYRNRMPTLREVAQEYIEHAPALARTPPSDSEASSERLSLTELAQQALSSAPPPAAPRPSPAAASPDDDALEPPREVASRRSVPPPAAIPPVIPTPPVAAEPWRNAVFPTPAPAPITRTTPALAQLSWAPPGADAPVSGHSAPVTAATPTASLGTVADAAPRDPTTDPPRFDAHPETFMPRALDADTPAASRGGPLFGKLRSWSSSLRPAQRASALGGVVLFALGGGFWIGSALQDDEPTALESSSGEQVTPAAAVKQRPAAAAQELGAQAEPPSPKTSATPTEQEPKVERDDRFAVRTQQSATSCDDALGKPFEAVAEPSPGKSGQYWSRSRKSLLRGRDDHALEQMCQSARWDLAGRGTYGLSEHYFKLADFEAALSWARRVPEDSRRYGDAQTMIGDLYSQQGRVQDALDVYLERWNLDRDDQPARDELAARFVHSAASARLKGDWWTAERYYRRALTLNPEDALGAGGLARAFVHFELHDAAAVWADYALDLDADSVQAAIALCDAQLGLEDRDKAQAALERLQKVAPSTPHLARLERQLRRLD